MIKKESYISTYSGNKFFPFNPKKEDVLIDDISRSLSNLARYNGHTEYMFSVAQHSVNCANILKFLGYNNRIVLLGLMHDTAEAYLGDYPSPIKKFIPELEEIENDILNVIFDRFDIEKPSKEEWDIVMEADKSLLLFEGVNITSNVNNWAYSYEQNLINLMSYSEFREDNSITYEAYENGEVLFPVDTSKKYFEEVNDEFLSYFFRTEGSWKI